MEALSDSRVDGPRLIQYLIHITESNNCAESDHKVLIHMKINVNVDELIKGWNNFLITKEQQFSNLDSLVEQTQEQPGQWTVCKNKHRSNLDSLVEQTKEQPGQFVKTNTGAT